MQSEQRMAATHAGPLGAQNAPLCSSVTPSANSRMLLAATSGSTAPPLSHALSNPTSLVICVRMNPGYESVPRPIVGGQSDGVSSSPAHAEPSATRHLRSTERLNGVARHSRTGMWRLTCTFTTVTPFGPRSRLNSLPTMFCAALLAWCP